MLSFVLTAMGTDQPKQAFGSPSMDFNDDIDEVLKAIESERLAREGASAEVVAFESDEDDHVGKMVRSTPAVCLTRLQPSWARPHPSLCEEHPL